MVQFSLKLQGNKVSRWDKYYVDYPRIKKAIKEIRTWKDSHEDAELVGSLLNEPHITPIAEDGLTIESIIKEEVNKVETFFCKESTAYLAELRLLLEEELQPYHGREAEMDSDDEYTSPTTQLATTIRSRKTYSTIGQRRSSGPPQLVRNRRRKDLDSVLRAVQDLYRRMYLLDSYAILNYTACVKATKKADKQLHLRPPLSPTILLYVNSKTFAKREELQGAISHCEKEFANVFCGQDRHQARALLLPNKLDSCTNWEQFRLGYRLGIALVLALWLVWDCGMESQRRHKDVTLAGQPAWRVYRGLSGMNAIPLLFPPGFLPLVLSAWMITRCLLPWSRMSKLWSTFGAVLLGIFGKVDFFGTYVADVMTSSVKTLIDLAYAIVYFISGDFLLDRHAWKARPVEDRWEEHTWYKDVLVPLICILPLWIRFQQCLRRFLDTGNRFPNLPNALKYAIAQLVSAMAVFHTKQTTMTVYNSVWLFLYITSSIYSFLWDVLIDWGLGDIQEGFLSKHQMYSRKAYYYIAIALDLVLRFNWVYSLVPPGNIPLKNFPTYISTCVMLLEFGRRTMWGLFRLEHEHLDNSFNYRKVSFVPLHFSTEIQEKDVKPMNGLRILSEVLGMAGVVIATTIVSIMLAKASNQEDDISNSQF